MNVYRRKKTDGRCKNKTRIKRASSFGDDAYNTHYNKVKYNRIRIVFDRCFAKPEVVQSP